jgi:hypothetical protein
MKHYANSAWTPVTVTAEIVGINHDELADGSGKAGLTLRIPDFPTEAVTWQGGSSSNYKYMWDECQGRKTYLIPFTTNTSYGVPSDLKAAMKTVKKTFYDHVDNTYNTVDDTVFLPSASELGFSTIYPKEGDCYELFKPNKSTAINWSELIVNNAIAGTSVKTWTRTKQDRSSGKVYTISTEGNLTTTTQTAGSVYGTAYICI